MRGACPRPTSHLSSPCALDFKYVHAQHHIPETSLLAKQGWLYALLCRQVTVQTSPFRKGPEEQCHGPMEMTSPHSQQRLQGQSLESGATPILQCVRNKGLLASGDAGSEPSLPHCQCKAVSLLSRVLSLFLLGCKFL